MRLGHFDSGVLESAESGSTTLRIPKSLTSAKVGIVLGGGVRYNSYIQAMIDRRRIIEGRLSCRMHMVFM